MSVNSKNLRCRTIHNGIPYEFVDEADMPNDIQPVGVYGNHQIPAGYVYSSTTEHFYFYNENLQQYRVLREKVIARKKGDTKSVIINDINGDSTYIYLSKYKKQLEQYEANRRRIHEQLVEEEPIEATEEEPIILEEPIEEEIEETIEDWFNETREELFSKQYTVKSEPYHYAFEREVNTSLRDYKRNHPNFTFNGRIRDYLESVGFRFVKTTVKINNETRKGVPLYRIETARFEAL